MQVRAYMYVRWMTDDDDDDVYTTHCQHFNVPVMLIV